MTNGSGRYTGRRLKKAICGIRFNSGVTGAFDFTKLVEPIPKRALSISDAFLERILLLYRYL